MNLENQQSEIANPNKLSHDLSISIEEALIKRALMPELSDTEWVKDNGKNFRELIKENPDLLDRYLKDSEKTLMFIEQQLKGEKTIH